MSERQPRSKRWSDDDSINYQLERSTSAEETIDSGTARAIAAQIDSPGSPAIHTFVTTGAILGEQFFDELGYEMNAAANDQERAQIEALAEYAATHPDMGPVQDWAQVWVVTPEGPVEWNVEPTARCVACGEHFANPHSVGCPLELDRFDDLG
ncbi:hypothetical protein [Rhodococcoides fascians]|uniref:hypothetical protein n=1 Tax=Rhodococcoides fascians TaxID=1828 RepID=UPI001D2D4206|nr:hypothetical protein [Rhodococcus fascians]CAH0189879.1 hypothetical protein SRABI91_01646 [Rhodococcus fascians]